MLAEKLLSRFLDVDIDDKKEVVLDISALDENTAYSAESLRHYLQH